MKITEEKRIEEKRKQEKKSVYFVNIIDVAKNTKQFLHFVIIYSCSYQCISKNKIFWSTFQ